MVRSQISVQIIFNDFLSLLLSQLFLLVLLVVLLTHLQDKLILFLLLLCYNLDSIAVGIEEITANFFIELCVTRGTLWSELSV